MTVAPLVKFKTTITSFCIMAHFHYLATDYVYRTQDTLKSNDNIGIFIFQYTLESFIGILMKMRMKILKI